MEPFRNETELFAELRSLRPAPRPAFAAELDERAAAGFPRHSDASNDPHEALVEWFRSLSPRRLILATGATALAAVAIATAVISTNEGNTGGQGALTLDARGQEGFSTIPKAAGPERDSAPKAQSSAPEFSNAPEASAGSAQSLEAPPVRTAPGSFAFGAAHRDIERSAEIVLGAEPTDVDEDAAEVFDAVHAANGIVLRSSTVEGPAGRAGAEFELLIPSAKLGDALADFSAIDEVRSRHEATADITAPTVAVEERLQDSRARIDGLLAQLAAAETESERETVEAELRTERRHVAFLRMRQAKLDRRANFSRVSLRIETGAASSHSDGGGTWGIGDALRDAGHILAIAAAVTLVSLAVLAPIALIAILAWLAQRTWTRRSRERALG